MNSKAQVEEKLSHEVQIYVCPFVVNVALNFSNKVKSYEFL